MTSNFVADNKKYNQPKRGQSNDYLSLADVVVEPVTLEEIQDQLQPLDLIFFRGTDIVSATICLLQEMTTGEGYWSHVGILVNSKILPQVPELLENEWYVWESTMSGDLPVGTDGVLRIEDNKGFFGVQMRNFRDVVTKYSEECGFVGWAPLKNNPWTLASSKSQRKKIIKKMHRLYYRYHNTRYNYNPIALAAAVIPCLRSLHPGMDDFDEYEGLMHIEPKKPKIIPAPGSRVIDAIESSRLTPLDEDFEIDDLELSEDEEGDDPVIFSNPQFQTTRAQFKTMLTLVNNHYADDPAKTGFLRQLDFIVANAGNKADKQNQEEGESSSPQRRPAPVRNKGKGNKKGKEPLERDSSDALKHEDTLDRDYHKYAKNSNSSSDRRKRASTIYDNLERYSYDGKLFCSEMVAKFFILIGIIDSKYDSRHVIPADFYSGLDIDGMPAICEKPAIIYSDLNEF